MDNQKTEIFDRAVRTDKLGTADRAVVANSDARRRRRYFKSEARHTLYKRNNWLIMMFGCFLVMMLTVGLKSMTGELFSIIDPNFLSVIVGTEMPSAVYLSGLIFDLLIVLLVFPVLMGLSNFASDVYESNGASSGVGEVFESFSSTRQLARSYRIIFSYMWRILLFAAIGAIGYYAIDLVYRMMYDKGDFTYALLAMISSYLFITAVTAICILVCMRGFLTSYIANKNPEMEVHRAAKASAYAMKGNKTEAFTLACSFIGWIALSVLTMGILLFMFTLPYMMLTFASFSEYVYSSKSGDIQSGNYKSGKKIRMKNIFTDNLDGESEEIEENV